MIPYLLMSGDPIRAIQESTKSIVQKVGNVFKEMFTSIGGLLSNLLPDSTLTKLSTSITKVRDKTVDLLQKLADNIYDVFNKFATQFPKTTVAIHDGLGKVSGAFASSLKTMGKMATAAMAAAGIFLVLGQAIAEFVQAADPAIVELLTTTIADLMAVIGRALAPLLQILQENIRVVADSLMTFTDMVGQLLETALRPLLPLVETFFNIFGKIGQIVVNAFMPFAEILAMITDLVNLLLKALEPILLILFELAGDLLKGLGEILKPIIQVLAIFVGVIAKFFEKLGNWILKVFEWGRGLLGLSSPTGMTRGSSVGAAVRQAQITDIENVIKTAQQSAYSLGLGATRTATSIGESLLKKVDLITEFLASIARTVEKVIDFFVWLFDADAWTRRILERDRHERARHYRDVAERFPVGDPEHFYWLALSEAASRDVRPGDVGPFIRRRMEEMRREFEEGRPPGAGGVVLGAVP